MFPPQYHRTLSNLVVQCNQSKAIEERPRTTLGRHWRPRHDLHPGNDADGLVVVSVQFIARRGNATQEIDQDIGVE
jgi:hypothetical protein